MNTEAQIKFDPISEVAAAVISGGILASDMETPFSNFLIKSNGNKSISDLNMSIKKQCTTLSESQNIVDKDLMLTKSLGSRSAKKVLIPGKKGLNKDQIPYQELSKILPVKLKTLDKQAVNTTGVKINNSGVSRTKITKNIVNGSIKITPQNLKHISGTNSDNENRQISQVDLKNGKNLNNQKSKNVLKSDTQNVLTGKLGNEPKIVTRNSVTVGKVVNRNKSVQPNSAHMVQGKQFSGKNIKNEPIARVELGKGKKPGNRNSVGQFKTDAHNVLKSKLGNEAKSVDRNANLNSSNRSKSVQPNSAQMVQRKQFSGIDMKNEPIARVELGKGKKSDIRSSVEQFKTDAQNILTSKSGNETKIAARNSVTVGNILNRNKNIQSDSASKIEEKQISGKDIKNEPIAGVELKGKLLNNSINARFEVHKNVQKGRLFVKDGNDNLTSTLAGKKNRYIQINLSKTSKYVESPNLKIRKTGKHLVNKANHSKLGDVNKVRSKDDNYYNYKYLKGNIGSSDNNQRFFLQEKYFSLRSEISAIGKHKNILDTAQVLPFTGIHQAEQMNTISNQSITGTGFTSAMMVQKITQIIFQSHEKQVSEMNLILDGERLGFLKVKFAQDLHGSQATIFVESNTARNLLEKVLPIINENLSQKGLMLNSLDVQVGDFGKPKTHNEKHNKNSGKSRVSNINVEVEDKINQIIAIRDYGYNTIEILA